MLRSTKRVAPDGAKIFTRGVFYKAVAPMGRMIRMDYLREYVIWEHGYTKHYTENLHLKCSYNAS
jgi:hypothetical protein